MAAHGRARPQPRPSPQRPLLTDLVSTNQNRVLTLLTNRRPVSIGLTNERPHSPPTPRPRTQTPGSSARQPDTEQLYQLCQAQSLCRCEKASRTPWNDSALQKTSKKFLELENFNIILVFNCVISCQGTKEFILELDNLKTKPFDFTNIPELDADIPLTSPCPPPRPAGPRCRL